MRTHQAAWTFAASLLALTLGACEGDGNHLYYGPPDQPGPGTCSQFSSCDSCTPVNGCGWCTNSDGTGTCASDPDECPTQTFSWTWNPSGCRVAADAGVGPAVDAGSLDDAAPGSWGPASSDATAASDATPWSDGASGSASVESGASSTTDAARAGDAAGSLP